MARDFIRPRQNSVFMTMLRAAWEADDFATANELHRGRAGVGFSAQAWAL